MLAFALGHGNGARANAPVARTPWPAAGETLRRVTTADEERCDVSLASPVASSASTKDAPHATCFWNSSHRRAAPRAGEAGRRRPAVATDASMRRTWLPELARRSNRRPAC